MTLKAMGSPSLKDLINVVSLIVTMGQIYVNSLTYGWISQE